MKAGSKGITLPPSIIAGIVSILLATSLIAVDGPGFPQQAYEAGQFIGQWDISHGANTRTTVMGFHRGWRFTDTRDLINQGGFQVWDISDLSNPVEVHRIDIRRSFHVFYFATESETYINSETGGGHGIKAASDVKIWLQEGFR